MSAPPCHCARPSRHLIRNMASGTERYVCEREECEWQAHCRLFDPSSRRYLDDGSRLYQAPGALVRPAGNDGVLPR